MRKTGVYAITNILNGKVYVGSAAKCISRRWTLHRNDLNSGRHGNRHLQSAWIKYGPHCFQFSVLGYCAPSECLALEQAWIEEYQSANPAFGYNIMPLAGSALGSKRTDEVRAKISRIQKGKIVSEATRLKISLAQKGRKLSDEFKLKLSQAVRAKGNKSHNFGKRRTESQKVTLSQAQLKRFNGQPLSDEYKSKISAALKGRTFSAETRAKISAIHTGMKASPEAIEKMRAARIGKKASPETRARLSASLRERHRLRKLAKAQLPDPNTLLNAPSAVASADGDALPLPSPASRVGVDFSYSASFALT